MSDTWYRDPLPPYSDWLGNLWTLDGECLNPVQGCEPPAWDAELALAKISAEVWMSTMEHMAEQIAAALPSYRRLYLNQWVSTAEPPVWVYRRKMR